jgi:hypothetical protein
MGRALDTETHWRRGLFRLWASLALVGALALAGYGLTRQRHLPWRGVSPALSASVAGWRHSAPFPQTWSLISIAVAAPAMALGLGLIAWWVIAGFRTPDASRTFGRPPKR